MLNIIIHIQQYIIIDYFELISLPKDFNNSVMFSEPESVHGDEAQLFICSHISGQEAANGGLPWIPPEKFIWFGFNSGAEHL